MKKCILTLFILFACKVILAQNNIYLKKHDGFQNNYPLSNVSKITFSEEGINLSFYNNTPDLYLYSDTRYLSFSPYNSNISDNVVTESLIYANPNTSDNEVIKALIYPNPVSTNLKIEYTTDVPNNITIELVNAQGKTIRNHNYTTIFGKSIFTIDLSNVDSGFYYCRILDGNIVKNEKIIKL